MKTSIKGRVGSLESGGGAECRERAMARSALYGEINDVRAMVEESAKSLATCNQSRIRQVALPSAMT